MNWLDYLRGYEEGRYDKTSSGQSPGLLGALLKLAGAMVFLSIAVSWLICKSIAGFLAWMIKQAIRSLKKNKKKLPRIMG